MIATLGLAFLAGALTILSPCVLPLLPIVLATAGSQTKWGPVALGIGVVVSFVTVGLFVALVGFSIGLNGHFFRTVAAFILVFLGLVLLIPSLQNRISLLASPLSAWAQNRMGDISSTGVAGQFGVGLLLGTVWSPCVGPTLGAASLLASRGKDIFHVALTMSSFAIGVGIPLVIIGLLSRNVLQRSRGTLMSASSKFKSVLGLILVVLGLLIISGYDKHVEAALVEASPDWLTNLTTKF
jgi:cytochrome c-type biogenesis protein